MERYVRSLDKRFRWLAVNPAAGRALDEIATGYRSFREGQHVVFYIENTDAIAIIGIPHQAMDLGTFFG